MGATALHHGSPGTHVCPLAIDVPDEQLADLRRRSSISWSARTGRSSSAGFEITFLDAGAHAHVFPYG